jgi:hypothetical protein
MVQPDQVLALQRSLGNRAATRVLLARAPPESGIREWPSKQATVAQAKKAASALEAAARAKGGFVPSWAVRLSTQLGWKAVPVAGMTATEVQLMTDVMEASEVIVGRSINVQGRGMLGLDDWLAARGIQWTQRWQDVYNKSLFLRTFSGTPVNVMAGAGYSAAEAMAAEEGAALAGITNKPYWPDAAPSGPAAGPTTGAGRTPLRLGGAGVGVGGRAIRLGIGFGLQALLIAFFWWVSKKAAKEEEKYRAKLIADKLDPAVGAALYDHSATIDSITARTPTKPLYANIEVDVDFRWEESGIAAARTGSEHMTDVRFVRMAFSHKDIKGDREISIERWGFPLTQTKSVFQTKRMTFSLQVFDPEYEVHKAEISKNWDRFTARYPRWRMKPVTGEAAEELGRMKWVHEVGFIQEWRRQEEMARIRNELGMDRPRSST